MSMATVFIEGRPFQVEAGENLLGACLELGFNLPYFCWHPALGSVGACRQCAIKQFRDEQDTRGKLVMACMTPAAEGMRISLGDADAVAFRKAIIEGLMLNHPHDCPVCDEGGECHLQDMTLMTGHDYRAYRFAKRTFRNQYLGPLINHEMNRCIQCYRCVRFYREYAGGADLNAFSLHDTVYFGRDKDGVLENEFSGNLVEVCPTGVFTDRTAKQHYTRKWDLQMAPSLCVHCGAGCNISAGERYGTLRRILNRYNGEVNGYFLCDRGRFGYEFVNQPQRLREPWLARNGVRTRISKADALQELGDIVSRSERIVGIGSPRASLESNFALRALVGPEHFYAGIADHEYGVLRTIAKLLRSGMARSPSIREMGECDAVFILGEDLTQTAPRLSLSIRQSVRRQPMALARQRGIPEWLDHAVRGAIQSRTGPLHIASLTPTSLDDIARHTFRGAPAELARLGFAVAHELTPQSPAAPGLSGEALSRAAEIASDLRSAAQPLIIAGTAARTPSILEAAANITTALRQAGKEPRLAFVTPECNSLGLTLLGGGSLGAAMATVQETRADTVIVLENDLFRRARTEYVQAFLEAARHVIALDCIDSRLAQSAELALPSGTFAEADGTMINGEGRAQRFFQAIAPTGAVQEAWRWLSDGMVAAGRDASSSWATLDDVTAALADSVPELSPVRRAAPPATFRADCEKIPRQPHRYSGRTAMHADIMVHEPKPPDDPDSPLSFSMEGYPGQPPAALIPFFWAPGWNSIQSVNKFQSEIPGPLRGGDPGIRLFEANPTMPATYFNAVPEAPSPSEDRWLVAPIHHIFGSEELSSLSPAIAELAPQSYVALSPGDSARLGVKEGDEASIELNGAVWRLRVRIVPGLADGTAGVPEGLEPLQGSTLPAWSRIWRP
jgi:NADH-quinone oxidoreductase subunit G